MKWSLNELHRYSDEPLHFNSTFDLKASLTKRFPKEILITTMATQQCLPML